MGDQNHPSVLLCSGKQEEAGELFLGLGVSLGKEVVMQHRQTGTLALGTSLDHVIRDDSADSRILRLGLVVAIAAHVLFFVVNWPSFAGSGPKVVEKQLPIVVLRHFKYIVPPTPLPQVRPRQQERIVPIPDPTPLDPEPIRIESAFSPEIISGDWVSSDGLDIPEPPPEVAEPALPRVGPEITAPRRIVTVEPIYPEAARRARIEGAVILSLIIGQSGTVESIEVLRGLPLGLTEAAVEAARQWVFEPSTYRGRPTAVQYNLTVRFTLN